MAAIDLICTQCGEKFVYKARHPFWRVVEILLALTFVVVGAYVALIVFGATMLSRQDPDRIFGFVFAGVFALVALASLYWALTALRGAFSYARCTKCKSTKYLPLLSAEGRAAMEHFRAAAAQEDPPEAPAGQKD